LAPQALLGFRAKGREIMKGDKGYQVKRYWTYFTTIKIKDDQVANEFLTINGLNRDQRFKG
jgi:hypothetical protein